MVRELVEGDEKRRRWEGKPAEEEEVCVVQEGDKFHHDEGVLVGGKWGNLKVFGSGGS